VAAGIDVYTTLNVQHLESLNDVVARVTEVPTRETVPDSILEEAAEVELVDLSPDDLIRRLRDGKVYVPEQAERALNSFFRKGNLIALRELALRTAAQRVDAEMRAYRSDHAAEAETDDPDPQAASSANVLRARSTATPPREGPRVPRFVDTRIRALVPLRL